MIKLKSPSGPGGQPPLDSLAATFDEAVRLHRAGEVVKALEMYRRVLAIYPRHADALQMAGVCAGQLGDPANGVPLVRRAIALRPHAPGYQLNLGNLLRMLGKIEEAAAAYRHAVHLDPLFADAQNNLGSALLLMRRPGSLEAAAAGGAAEAGFPGDPAQSRHRAAGPGPAGGGETGAAQPPQAPSRRRRGAQAAGAGRTGRRHGRVTFRAIFRALNSLL